MSIAEQHQGPCTPWADVDAARSCTACDDSFEYDDDLLTQSLIIASDVLYLLSGQRWAGECESTSRPTARACRGCAPIACRCSQYRLHLGVSYVREVTELIIDGQVVPEDEYQIENDRFLVLRRSAGAARKHFQLYQDTALASTEKGTMEVSFTFGQDPPPLGVTAAGVLACELVKSCIPGAPCRLDARVTNKTRQGVTLAFPGLVDLIKDGATGISEVDLFLATYNPNKLRRSARVLSADTGVAARRVR